MVILTHPGETQRKYHRSHITLVISGWLKKLLSPRKTADLFKMWHLNNYTRFEKYLLAAVSYYMPVTIAIQHFDAVAIDSRSPKRR